MTLTKYDEFNNTIVLTDCPGFLNGEVWDFYQTHQITGQNENTRDSVSQSAARIQMMSHREAQKGWHISYVTLLVGT